MMARLAPPDDDTIYNCAMLKIVRLEPGDALRLRAIRMAALRDTPDAFASTLQEAEGRTPDKWARGIAELPTFIAVLDGADVGLARGAPVAERCDAYNAMDRLTHVLIRSHGS